MTRALTKKVPLLLAFEVAFFLYLWGSPNPHQRSYLFDYWHVIIFFFFWMMVAAFLERRSSSIPFPFAERLSAGEHVECFIMTAIGIFLSQLVVPMLWSKLNILPEWFFLEIAYKMMRAMHTGIAEETFKVGLTNVIAYLPFRMAKREKVKQLTVAFSGIGAVAFIAVPHFSIDKG